MFFKSHFFATAALICFCTLATSVQAGQLFPPGGLPTNAEGEPDATQNCPNGEVLSWNGANGAVECVDPTSGVTISCPAGQVLTGITNGQALCKRLGVFSAVAGQSVTCSYNFVSQNGVGHIVTYYGKVDENGQPFVRINIADVDDTGWVAGTYLEDRTLSPVWYPGLTMTTSGIMGWHYEDHGYYPPQSSYPIDTSLQEMAGTCLGQFTY